MCFEILPQQNIKPVIHPKSFRISRRPPVFIFRVCKSSDMLRSARYCITGENGLKTGRLSDLFRESAAACHF